MGLLRVLGAITVLAMASCGDRPPPVEFALEYSCEPCGLRADTLWRSVLGDPGVANPPRVLELDQGRVLIVDPMSDQLVLFDNAGRSIRRVGGRGEAPGEFLGLRGLERLSSREVLALSSDRVTVLDTDLEYVSSFELPGRNYGRGAAIIGDTSIVVEAGVPSLGEAVHRFSLQSGRLERTMVLGHPVATGSTLERGESWVWFSPLVPHSDSIGFHVLGFHPVDGRIVQRIQRRPEWFTTWYPNPTSEGGGEPTRPWPKMPWVYEVVERQGYLWAVTIVSDPRFPSEQADVNSDSILEILDPESGEVIFATRFDALLTGFTNEGNAVFYSETNVGEPQLNIVDLSLQGTD